MGVVLTLARPYQCALASKGFKGLNGLHFPIPAVSESSRLVTRPLSVANVMAILSASSRISYFAAPICFGIEAFSSMETCAPGRSNRMAVVLAVCL